MKTLKNTNISVHKSLVVLHAADGAVEAFPVSKILRVRYLHTRMSKTEYERFCEEYPDVAQRTPDRAALLGIKLRDVYCCLITLVSQDTYTFETEDGGAFGRFMSAIGYDPLL